MTISLHRWLWPALIVCALTPVHSWANDNVLGEWAGESSIIHVTRNAGSLSAVIIALQDPLYLEDEDAGLTGANRLDDRNPEATLRQRPLIGLELLQDYEFDGDRWEGKIYDPESGNVYSSRMEVSRGGKLKMRGYIGLPMMGRTAVFEPLSVCDGRMQEMLQRSQQTATTCPQNDKTRH